MPQRAEVTELIEGIEAHARDHSALANRVSRIAKTTTPEERRAIWNALRETRGQFATHLAKMFAEVA